MGTVVLFVHIIQIVPQESISSGMFGLHPALLPTHFYRLTYILLAYDLSLPLMLEAFAGTRNPDAIIGGDVVNDEVRFGWAGAVRKWPALGDSEDICF